MPLDHDHVGVQMQTNDSFSLGASSRHYLLEVHWGLGFRVQGLGFRVIAAPCLLFVDFEHALTALFKMQLYIQFMSFVRA